MEVNFESNMLDCMDFAVREIQNSEQTQEIKLPDGMPDIGQVTAAWAQPILRGKEWRADCISFSGGMMVWVLYQSEDGTQMQCIETWIPFQMRWDLPEETPEGVIRIHCLPRFADARVLSPRKMMVRTGMAVFAEALVPRTAEVFSSQEQPEDIQLLRSTYPVRLYREAGEKTFQLDEELKLPDSVPKPEKRISWRMQPQVLDKRILGGKLVFRGKGNLQVFYRSEEGQFHSWNFELPFSQFAQLEAQYGSDAQADVSIMPTNLELEQDEEGNLHLKAALVAQYLITDLHKLELVEDAYSPGRELEVHQTVLELPVVLEERMEVFSAQQQISAAANIAVDSWFMPDFPRVRNQLDTVELELPGTLQLVYYGEDGDLHCTNARWESRSQIQADSSSRIYAMPMPAESQTTLGLDQIHVRTELPVRLQTMTLQNIPMVTGAQLGQKRMPDPNRPSLILRRAGEARLWEIAKDSGSTVEAIRRANKLQEEPVAGQMLLIPVL